MTANVTSTSAVPDPTYGTATPATTNPNPSAASGDSQTNTPNPADLRLVIEDDPKAGCFVYKTIDWRTGQVVSQLPREQLVKMREAENYSAGDVIDTSA
jgi:flagellar protein FlaG